MPSNYPDRDYILSGIKEGFRITDVEHSGVKVEVDNYTSAIQNKELVEEQLLSEIKNGRIVITEKKPKVINAMGAILKSEKDKDKVRLISDLSMPQDLNLNNLVKDSRTYYDDISVARELIDPEDWLAKLDLQGAYRSVFIHPDEHELLGLKWTFRGDSHPTYLKDNFLPFGSSKSPQIFMKLSRAVQFMTQQAGFKNILVYLDDWLIIQKTKEKCTKAQNYLITLLRLLGFQISYSKCVSPTQELSFLGVNFSTIGFNLSIPSKKISDLYFKTLDVYNAKSVTKVQLQRLLGLMNWISQIVPLSRLYTRKIYDRCNLLAAKNHMCRITEDVRWDLWWWIKELTKYNGLQPIRTHRLKFHTVSSDSSQEGAGIFFHNKAFVYSDWASWGSEINNLSITYKEAIAAMIPLILCAPLFSDSMVYCHTDNIGASFILNKASSKEPIIVDLLKRVYSLSIQFNFSFKCVYYPGICNYISDAISRIQAPGGVRRLEQVLAGLKPCGSHKESDIDPFLKELAWRSGGHRLNLNTSLF